MRAGLHNLIGVLGKGWLDLGSDTRQIVDGWLYWKSQMCNKGINTRYDITSNVNIVSKYTPST